MRADDVTTLGGQTLNKHQLKLPPERDAPLTADDQLGEVARAGFEELYVAEAEFGEMTSIEKPV